MIRFPQIDLIYEDQKGTIKCFLKVGCGGPTQFKEKKYFCGYGGNNAPLLEEEDALYKAGQ